MNCNIEDYFHGKINCNRIQDDQDDKYGFSRKDYFECIYNLSKINNEDKILGVIIGTFAIGFNALRKDFPQLFGNTSNIPVLLLHGSLRGEKYYVNKDKNGKKSLKIDLKYLNKQEDKVIDAYVGPTNTNLNINLHQNSNEKDNYVYYIGDKVYIQRITAQHYGDFDFGTTNDSNGNNNSNNQKNNPNGINDENEDEYEIIDSNGERSMGVNHPKYMLIFTKKGVHVMISTANMCTQYSVDSSWTQFFPKKMEKVKKNLDMIGSDFGDVLQDFLDHQGKQIDANEAKYGGKITTPEEFIQKFVHDKNFKISDLTYLYCFELSKVDLISVVPSKISIPGYKSKVNEIYKYQPPCDDCEMHNSSLRKSDIKYGRDRVQQLLQRHESKLKLSKINDGDQVENKSEIKLGKLVLQPTSIGNNLTMDYMQQLWNCYRYAESEDKEHEHDWNHYLKLIWPDEKYVGHSCGSLFLKPNCLKSLNHCWDNMFTMEPRSYMNDVFDDQFIYSNMKADDEEVRLSRPVPHIKSYCRLMDDGGDDSECDCVQMAWYIMTSACLSEGAQGVKVEEQECPLNNTINCGAQKRHPYYLYRNFELGIMIHSTSDKQLYQKGYKCRNSLKPCKLCIRDGSYAVPIPYELNGGKKYYKNNKFDHRPMFDNVDEKDLKTLEFLELPKSYFNKNAREVDQEESPEKKQKVKHLETTDLLDFVG